MSEPVETPVALEPITFKHVYAGELLNESFLKALLAIKDVKLLPLHNRSGLRTMLELFDTYLKDINEKRNELVEKYHTSTNEAGVFTVDPKVMPKDKLGEFTKEWYEFENERLPTNLADLFRMPLGYIDALTMTQEDMVRRFIILPKDA